MKNRISALILAASVAVTSIGCSTKSTVSNPNPSVTASEDAAASAEDQNSGELGELDLSRRDYFRCYKPAIEALQARYSEDIAALKAMKYTLYDIDGDDNFELIIDVNSNEAAHRVWVYSTRGGKPLELPYSTFEDQKITAESTSANGIGEVGADSSENYEDSGESDESEGSDESGEISEEGGSGSSEGFSAKNVVFYDSPTGLIFSRGTGAKAQISQLFIKNGQFGENSLIDEEGNAKIEDYAPKDIEWYDAGCVDGLIDYSKMEDIKYKVKTKSKIADKNNTDDNICVVEYPVLKKSKYSEVNKSIKSEMKALFSENKHFGNKAAAGGDGTRNSYFKATVAAVSEMEEKLSIVICVEQMTQDGVLFTLRGYNYSAKDGRRLTNEEFYSDEDNSYEDTSIYCIFKSLYYEKSLESREGLFISKMVLDGDKALSDYMNGDDESDSSDSSESSSDSSSDSDSSYSSSQDRDYDSSSSENSSSSSDSESSNSDSGGSSESSSSESSSESSSDSGGSGSEESSEDSGGSSSEESGSSDSASDAVEEGE